MSGIVGSKFNHRGSGLVASYGTDGQHMLSAGAGKTNVFETVSAGGGVKQIKQVIYNDHDTFSSGTYIQVDATNAAVTLTPGAADSSFRIVFNIAGGVANHDVGAGWNIFDSQVGVSDGDELMAEGITGGNRLKSFQSNTEYFGSSSTVDDYMCPITSIDVMYTPASNNDSARTFSLAARKTHANPGNLLMNHGQHDWSNSRVTTLQVWEIANGIYT